MKSYPKFTAWFLIAGLFVSVTTKAQKVELGGSLGGILYKGDVAPALNPLFYRPAGQLFFRYNATPSLSLRASGLIGQFGASDSRSNDPFQQARNYDFKTSVGEASIDLEYNFLDYKPLRKIKNWTPYVFGGVALYNVNPRDRVDRSKGISGKIAYPLGVGIKYEFKLPWSVGFEFGTRFTNNDYLDGLGDATNRDKFQQGNPSLKDHYTYTGISLFYTFYRITCPDGSQF
ncbi:hypothetical protein GCM10023189_29190 [Nibrella saemangeumensis]|uniref:DUF6089 domain-containing protein n=1 Tax=Nibrella saemangeumensis TaxID=1084526 RepID=A0ABP8MXL3_9BACT